MDPRRVLLLLPLALLASACATGRRTSRAAEAPLFEARIAVSSATEMRSRLEPGLLEYTGITLSDLVAFSHPDSRLRLGLSSPQASRRYDVLVRGGGAADSPEPSLLREAVDRTFSLEAARKRKSTDVYFLKPSGREGSRIKRSARADGAGGGGGSGPEGGELSLENGLIADLAASLEVYVKRPVIDDSGLSGRYDLSLQWDPKRKGSLEKAMLEQLGLTLVPGKAELEMLEIRGAP